MTENLRRAAEAALTDPAHFLVDLRTKGQQPVHVVVLVDGDEGISIDDCAQISRRLADAIETENLIETAYRLEVSSPGVDHPLQSVRQFRKNVGRTLHLWLDDATEVTGRLTAVNEKAITIVKQNGGKKKARKPPPTDETTAVEVPLARIQKTRVVVSFR